MRELALEVYLSSWRMAARHHLTASDSETLTLAELLRFADDEDRQRWESAQLSYGEARGAPWLRDAIVAGYESVTADSVICFAGAQEGINAAMHSLLQADAHAITVTPNYQSIETITASLCAVTDVPLDPSRGWALDIAAVDRAIRPNTRLISVNFPNNPTGKILDRDCFDELVTLCRKHGIWLFSDEIYRLIERNPATRLPAAVDAYERGISLGSVSKSYGLPGLRVGWIACRNAEFLSALEREKHYLSNCIATPCELLAYMAIKAGDYILPRNRHIAEMNLALLNGFFAEHRNLFSWQIPDGGVVGYPEYHGGDGVEAFCTHLVEEHGVLLLPASVYRSEFSSAPENHFRIGFGRRDFASGLAALELGLQRRPVRARYVG
jgi:aspartate/methionine/tyrosine aminotransferase